MYLMAFYSAVGVIFGFGFLLEALLDNNQLTNNRGDN